MVIRKASSSTSQGASLALRAPLTPPATTRHCLPDRALQPLESHVAGVDIQALWKNTVIILILKTWEALQTRPLLLPISLLCPATKILERILLPTTVGRRRLWELAPPIMTPFAFPSGAGEGPTEIRHLTSPL